METAPTFAPNTGLSREDLLRVPAPDPAPDFVAFWQETYRQTLLQPLHISKREVTSPVRDIQLFEIEFNSLGGFRVGAWLTVPRNAHFERGLVASHGYGGREAPNFSPSGPPCAAIFPCARGFNRSARPDIPANAANHVLHGIASRETYIHRGCVADLWVAASVLLELFPHLAGHVDFEGGSFGGGIGTLMLPWDARFGRAYLDVPSFGNHPLRVQLPCSGSGEAVRIYHRTHPEVLDVLRYFDAAVAARFISTPTFVAAALSDPAVPPPGQFAVYNALSSPKELFVRRSGHPSDANDDAQISQHLEAWFDR